MKKMALWTMVAGVSSLMNAGTASAGYIYQVNASLQYGGTLTGTITLNDANTAVASYSLTTTATPGSAGFNFSGFLYNPSDSAIASNLTNNVLTIDAPSTAGYTDQLQLTFTGAGLTSAGGTLVTNGTSFEYESVAGNRTIVSGTVVAVPEPSSLALCGISGAVGLGLARARRRRPA